MAAAEDVQLFAGPRELENLIGLGMDGHVQVRVNLQAAAVHNLYSAKALGCIVNGHHGHGHDFLQDLNGVEWNGERLMVT